ncbi:MAG: ECF-type sigma factor [Phycisphaerales bacterium]|nr:ECF-type sigma factor [Phycisphaerales bacterium]
MLAKQDRYKADSVLLAVYDEMRRMAAELLGAQRFMHTLPPTAVVHEAYLRIMGAELWAEMDRAAVMALATRAMRSVLVDHARRRRAAKRGGNNKQVALDEVILVFETRGYDLIELDSTLRRLAEVDPRLVRIVEMRFFSGLSVEEIAGVLQISTRTVRRDWAVARAWLRSEYEGTRHAC